MAFLSTPPCYRAVRCRLRPPQYDSIWVPGSLLVSASDRYAATSRTIKRHGSCTPGPMEHRKRLARRHLGELHFGQSHSAAPIWELASLVDLTRWQWQPPTLLDAKNRQNVGATGIQALSHAVMSPLRSLFPPRIDSTVELNSPDETLLPDGITLSSVAEPSLFSSWGIRHAPSDIIDAGLVSISLDVMNRVEGVPNFPRFCDSWQQALENGLFHGEAVGKVLSGIADALNMEPLNTHGPRTIDYLKLRLVQATIEGVSKREAQKTTPFDPMVWNSILHSVSTIKMNTCRLFTRAMECIPDHCTITVSAGIIDNLGAFLDALGRATDPSSIARQAAKTAVPLKNLGRPELRFILDTVNQKLANYTGVEGDYTLNVRFSWLHLLARLPDVDIDYLSSVCAALEANPTFGPLTEPEVCQLFLAWAHRQTPLQHYVRLRRLILDYGGRSCYSRLGSQLWRTRQYSRARDFIRFLDGIGRQGAITWLVYAVNHHPKGPLSLACMALGIRKPLVALDIFCLYEQCRERKKSFWRSHYGFKALELLLWTPGFDYKRLWRLLGIDTHRYLRPRYHRRIQLLDRIRVSKITATVIVIGLSPFMSRRKAFFFIKACYTFLRRHYVKLPPTFLRALVYSVTKDFDDGQPGITARLRYALYVIQRERGNLHAQSVALTIWRRRMAVFQSDNQS
ncbi:hypothetical protein GGS21DRAFT_492564 [Xylaria nigripes]|nr:hypothetical protein GGS21DRAFT_492564 [Xylaria nigripes]